MTTQLLGLRSSCLLCLSKALLVHKPLAGFVNSSRVLLHCLLQFVFHLLQPDFRLLQTSFSESFAFLSSSQLLLYFLP